MAGCQKAANDEVAAARKSIAAHETAAALIHLKNAAAAEPKNGEVRLLLGQQLAASGDHRGAVIEFNRALELKLPVARVLPGLSESLLASGRPEEVLTLVGNAATEGKPVDAAMETLRARAYLSLGNIAKARQAIERAVASDPRQPTARLVRARISQAEGKMAEAMKGVDELLADAPDDPKAWNLKGDLQLRNPGGRERALEAYRKAIALDPRMVEPRGAEVGLLLARRDLPAAKDSLAALRKLDPAGFLTNFYGARILHLEGKFAEARPLFVAALNRSPEHPTALLAAGVNELKLDAPAMAESMLAQAVRHDPGNAGARFYLARAAMLLGRPTQAIEALAPLLTADVPPPDVLLLAAQAHLIQGDAAGANTLFERAKKLHAKDTAVRLANAAVAAAKGDTDGSLDELKIAAEGDNSIQAGLSLISALLARRDYDGALNAIEAFERKHPKLPAAMDLRGQTLLKRNDTAGARKAFEAALGVEPNYFSSVANLTELDVADKRFDEARQRLDDVVKRQPTNVLARMALANVAMRQGATPETVLDLLEKAVRSDPRDPRPRLALVDYHYRRGAVARAVDAVQEAATAIPNSPQLYEVLADGQIRLGKKTEAFATYGRLMRLAPTVPSGYLGQAKILLSQGKGDDALKTLQPLLNLMPKQVEALRLQGAAYLQTRRPAEALAVTRQMQRDSPDSPQGFALEGEVHMSQGHWPQAATAYRQALSKPGSDELVSRLHAALLAGKQTSEANALVTSWLAKHPRDSAFLRYLAELAMSSSDPAEARRRLEQAVAADPKDGAAVNNLAWLLLKDSPQEALKVAEQAVALMPDSPDVLDTLAQAYTANKQHAKAIEALKRAVNRAADPSPLRLTLAKAYLANGETGNARAELDRLRDLGRAFPGQAEVRALLAKLRE